MWMTFIQLFARLVVLPSNCKHFVAVCECGVAEREREKRKTRVLCVCVCTCVCTCSYTGKGLRGKPKVVVVGCFTCV